MIEQEVRADWSTGNDGTPGYVGAGTVVTQYVWGAAYVNDLVSRDVITAGTSGSSSDKGWVAASDVNRVFTQQDANWDITSMVSFSPVVVSGGHSLEVSVRQKFDPFGLVQQTLTGTTTNMGNGADVRPGYQGGFTDPDSKMTLFGARWYDPNSLRWMTEDPSGYPDGYNRFQFALSSPCGTRDFTGLDPDDKKVIVVIPKSNPGGPAGNLSEAAGAHAAIRIGNTVYDFGTYKGGPYTIGGSNWRKVPYRQYPPLVSSNDWIFEFDLNISMDKLKEAVDKYITAHLNDEYNLSSCNCAGQVRGLIRQASGKPPENSGTVVTPKDLEGRDGVSSKPSGPPVSGSKK